MGEIDGVLVFVERGGGGGIGGGGISGSWAWKCVAARGLLC